uniref:Uncharacterized protein n=1 Tax=viral metagenome TaxID=1070528 RepID=A0A6M3LBI3_9ZZZZ
MDCPILIIEQIKANMRILTLEQLQCVERITTELATQDGVPAQYIEK